MISLIIGALIGFGISTFFIYSKGGTAEYINNKITDLTKTNNEIIEEINKSNYKSEYQRGVENTLIQINEIINEF